MTKADKAAPKIIIETMKLTVGLPANYAAFISAADGAANPSQ
ncbi:MULTISPECIES: hypothetical protein [unclassified Corynebacterium]|nr:MULTISPECIES: hypothetical protein [unclassified Corynebacterium]WKK63719.1 hypothetical protein QYR04_02075 [Corynebacterium sp. P8-C1]